MSKDPPNGVALRFVIEDLYLRANGTYKQIQQAGCHGLLQQFLNIKKGKGIFDDGFGDSITNRIVDLWCEQYGMDKYEARSSLRNLTFNYTDKDSGETLELTFHERQGPSEVKKLDNHEKSLLASKIAMTFFLILIENSGSVYIEEMTEPCEQNQRSGFPEYGNPEWWHQYHKQRYIFKQTLDDELPKEQREEVERVIRNTYDTVPF